MNTTAHERYVQKPFLGSSHSWAYQQLDLVGSDARVLDVGPGSGLFGHYLQNKGVQELHAIEIDPTTREHLAPLYTSIEDSLDPYMQDTFDVILFLDVLEHMTDPFSFFQSACSLLSPGGMVLISLPNIAHWSVRFQLLFGQFNYTERGLLDKTHFQFFTKKRVKQLVASVDSVVMKEYSASIEPVELLLPEWAWNNAGFRCLSQLRQGCARLWPGMLAFQHLVRVERTS